MGLIKWLKKEMDGSILQRRESAPARSLKNPFDLNKSRDDAYLRAFAKFNEYRTNDVPKRNEHRYDGDDEDIVASSNGDASSVAYRHHPNGMSEEEMSAVYASSSRSVQPKTTYQKRIPRHSMPANVTKAKKKQRQKQTTLDSSIIHEDEVREFEAAHCFDDIESMPEVHHKTVNSPPMKFYKQNLNPYPRNEQDTAMAATQLFANNESLYRTCPEKPKRMLLKQQDQRLKKELSNAHFNGTYQDYEIQSTRYNSDSIEPKSNAVYRTAAMTSSSSNDGKSIDDNPMTSNLLRDSQYQVIVNKHGDFVEYALPMNEQLERRQTKEIHAEIEEPEEEFCEDSVACERMINENFHFLNQISPEVEFGHGGMASVPVTSNTARVMVTDLDKSNDFDESTRNRPFVPVTDLDKSLDTNYVRRRKSKPVATMTSSKATHKQHVMITDLDKSMESSRTLDATKRNSNAIFDDLNSLSKWSDNLYARNSRLKFEANQRFASSMLCSLKDLKPITTLPGMLSIGSLSYWQGNYRTTKVSLRNYNTETETNAEFVAFADSVIQRDYDVLRQIRHKDIIILMGIACESDQRIDTLIMQPMDCTLSHALHCQNVRVSIGDAIEIVQQVASATLYLQECGFIHSNISSQTVAVTGFPNVKLTSFELATNIALDTQNEIEAKFKRSSKVIIPSDADLSQTIITNVTSKNSGSLSKLYEQYRHRSKIVASESEMKTMFASTPCVRDLPTTFLPYCVEYRQRLSSFRHQAPELLTIGERFVFPTVQSDVYALSLLLWELLNGSVPYAIFDIDELQKLFSVKQNKVQIPIFDEKRCTKFTQIFKFILRTDPLNRSVTVHHLMVWLDDIKAEMATQAKDRSRMLSTIDSSLMDTRLSKSRHGYDMPKKQNSQFSENIYENASEIKANEGEFSLMFSPMSNESKSINQRNARSASKVSPATVGNDGKVLSPLNNVTNSTLYRSMLDFQKLLSPRRATNANAYERTSTLKKRRKPTPEDKTKKNMRELFEQPINSGVTVEETKLSADDFSPKLNENIINSRLGVTNASPSIDEKTRASIARSLDYRVNGESSKLNSNERKKNEKNTSLSKNQQNNASYQFAIDEYELPQHLIARNNKIRRNTWLSSDTVNSTQNASIDNTKSAVIAPKTTPSKLQTLNESDGSNKKLNVSIKIVHKQVSTDENDRSAIVQNQSNESEISLRSNASDKRLDNSIDDSPSVMARVKFFTSLENPNNFTLGAANKTGRRSEISFDEAVKAKCRARAKALQQMSPQPKLRRGDGEKQLLQEVKDITAEISKSLSNKRIEHLLRSQPTTKSADDTLDGRNDVDNPKTAKDIEKALFSSDGSIVALAEQLFGHENFTNSDEQSVEEKRKSVKETIQSFENSMHKQNIGETTANNNKNDASFKKIENKLLNKKMINSDTKCDEKIDGNEEVTNEKIEEVMQIVGLPECENDAAMTMAMMAQSNQTLIKRTFYQESIVSGTNVEQMEKMLDAQCPASPATSTTTTTTSISSTKKLTTRVTLNLRQFKRRLSDVGALTHGQNAASMTDVRHSICGSEIIGSFSKQALQNIATTSGRSLEEIAKNQTENDCENQNQMSCTDTSTMEMQSKQVQSIEDLYIDDDFCQGVSLAANMKLFTTSNDTLDNINFDLISTHIYEETSESTLLTRTSALPQRDLLQIEYTNVDDDAKNETNLENVDTVGQQTSEL